MEGSLVAYKVFTNGSTLQASELNENLMQQSVAVFSNAAARTAAITSPVEGQMTWLEDVNAYEYYNGTSWVSAAIGIGSGLVHIATQTVSGVTAVNFNNVFSSTYRSYRVVLDGKTTARNEVFARLRVGGVDATGSNYTSRIIFRDGGGTGGTGSTTTSSSIAYTETGSTVASFDIVSPFLISQTALNSYSYGQGGDSVLWLSGSGHNLSNSYDGISILSTSSFTGQISIYGYRN
jgi:hypothetical protein